MKARLTLRNYRCFREEQPAVFEVGPGFTAFIGPNNAGKSTLLKFFYEIRGALQHLQGLRSGSAIGGMFPGNWVGIGGLPHPITDPVEIVYENARSPFQFELQVESEDDQPFIKTAVWTYKTPEQAWNIELISSEGNSLKRDGDAPHIVSFEAEAVVLNTGIRLGFNNLLLAAKCLADMQYLGPFRNAVNEGAGSYYDLQLGTAFLAQWHIWKTGGTKQMNRDISRVTEDIRRLINVESLEINASNELKTLQLSIDGRPHKLSELGAGIAQLIVVLGNALIRRPSFIAIDEPETHLHPALQLDFLTTLASYASQGVLFATHSIGLARAGADRLYSVQSTANGSLVRPYEKTPRYAEFLGSLGIAGLQDIGWSKVLLVEGSTDVKTYQQLLRKYDKERQFVILPLGGSSMIHGGTTPQLEEVVKLCDNVFAVIDSEKVSAAHTLSKGRSDFAKNCENLRIKCLVTERRATENYLSDRSVKETFGDKYAALENFGAPNPQTPFWGKTENWRVALQMRKEELDQTDLGRFLASI